MKLTSTWIIILFVLILLLFSMSVYTIQQFQLGLLTQLGQIVVNSKTGKPLIEEPGLHFKTPFISQVLKYDTRIQTFDIQSSRVVTKLQKDVLVDYYAKWQIDNLPLYYTRTDGRPEVVKTLLEQKLNDSLRAEFGKRTLKQVIADDRSAIMTALQDQANQSARELGIKIVDVRIKGIDLPSQVSDAVYQRMRTQRQQVATEFRAKGKATASAIQAQADATAQVIFAKAKETAQTMQAEGDAVAAQIYAAAYQQDPEFYAFYRSLLAYKNAFNSKQNIFLLQPDSQFFKYFNSTGKTNNNDTH